MATYLAVRQGLLALAEHLHMADTVPPAGSSLPAVTLRLARHVGETFPRGAATSEAEALHEEAMALSPQAIASHERQFLSQMGTVLDRLRDDADALPRCRQWWLAWQTHELHESYEKLCETRPNPALGEWLGELVDRRWQEAALRDDPAVDRLRRDIAGPPGTDLLQGSGRLLQRWTEDRPAQLADLLYRLPFALESRLRQCWMEDRATPATGLADFYTMAWDDLLGLPPGVKRSEPLSTLLPLCQQACEQLDLPEGDPYVCDPQAVIHYALAFLLPPNPDGCALRDLDGLDRYFAGQTARWHFYVFRRPLEPLQMVGAVLRAGRPFLYERALAHAALQYAMVVTAPAAGPLGEVHLEVLAALRRNFKVLFDHFLLRRLWRDRWRRNLDWVAYLEAMLALQGEGRSTPELEECRHDWLRARALSSCDEVLAGLGRGAVRVH